MTKTNALPKTPGYNTHLTVRFSVTKNGQPRAHYWSPRGFRWLPMKRQDAEMFVAQGLATRADR